MSCLHVLLTLGPLHGVLHDAERDYQRTTSNNLTGAKT